MGVEKPLGKNQQQFIHLFSQAATLYSTVYVKQNCYIFFQLVCCNFSLFLRIYIIIKTLPAQSFTMHM